MITQDELLISNQSYTNKDFISIYPELLDFIKKISPKWDPSSSNESDPGNVLLKALAFIADKTNYNTDKNTLENFLPSATQETSAYNLCIEQGYFPKYYQSAITDITVRYDGKSLSEGESFTLPAMETVFTDESGETFFSLLEPLTISKRKTPVTKPIIQGTFDTLVVGGSETIQLTDLDDNNRIYLPEPMIAENGTFVFSADSYSRGTSTTDSWERVDNLNLVEPTDTSYVFKFGYDSYERLPYIEFPDNIANLIGSGVIIKYVKTTGSNGNISVGVLNTLSTPQTVAVSGNADKSIDFSVPEEGTDTESESGTLFIINKSSTINGRDPETIDEAYNSYKKTVGTFTTLVTCRDYANAIYNLTDNLSQPYISNVQVADRRTDINLANVVVSYSSVGQVNKYKEDTTKITPYDLCVYALRPMGSAYTLDNYIDSFKPASSSEDMPYIYDELENNLKTISHNYVDDLDTSSKIYAIKNYCKLNAYLVTTYKVNSFERKEIEDKVRQVLYNKFNARNVDFGYEIPFETIMDAIKGADPRIKNVSLRVSEVNPYVMFGDGSEISISAENEQTEIRDNLIAVLAKNILAGKLPAFNYDYDFEYSYGQTNYKPAGSSSVVGPKEDNIKTLATEVTIGPSLEIGDGPKKYKYKLRANEVIQCIAPNLSSIITYPAYTLFRYENADTNKTIPANTEYELTGTDVLKIAYTDSNKNFICMEYSAAGTKQNGTLISQPPVYIKSSFDIKQVRGTADQTSQELYNENQRSVNTQHQWVDGKTFVAFTATTNEQIEIREIVSREITDNNLYCYWSTDRLNNNLFNGTDSIGGGDYERLLGDNEYFAYCDASKTDLVILGSGTVLKYHCTGTLNPNDWNCVKTLVDTLSEDGLTVFEDFNWIVKNFSKNPLEVCDMQILTLVEDDVIEFRETDAQHTSNPITSINNTWKLLDKDTNIMYTIEGENPKPLSKAGSDELAWRIRSRLDLNCGPTLPQEILGYTQVNGDWSQSYHRIKGWLKGNDDWPNNPSFEIANTENMSLATYYPIFFELNQPIQKIGGSNIDMGVTVLSMNEETRVEYLIDALIYRMVRDEDNSNNRLLEFNDNSLKSIDDFLADDYIVFNVSDLKFDASGDYTLKLPILTLGTTEQQLLMFYAMKTAGSTYSIDLYSGSSTIDIIKNVDSVNMGLDTTVELLISVGRDEKLTVVEKYGSPATSADGIQELTLKFHRESGDEDKECKLVMKLPQGIHYHRTEADSHYLPTMNDKFGLSDAESDSLMTKLSGNDFYYNNDIDNTKIISAKTIPSAEFFWDKNNWFNKFTIEEIDFENSDIEVELSSRL